MKRRVKQQLNTMNILQDVKGNSKYSPDDVMMRESYLERLGSTWNAIHGTGTTLSITKRGKNLFANKGYSDWDTGYSYGHWGASDYVFLGLTRGIERINNTTKGMFLIGPAFRFFKVIVFDIPKLIVSGVLFVPSAIGATIAHGIESIRIRSFAKKAGHIPTTPKTSETERKESEEEDAYLEETSEATLTHSTVLSAIKTFNNQSQGTNAREAVLNLESRTSLKEAKLENGKLVLKVKERENFNYEQLDEHYEQLDEQVIELDTKDKKQNQVIRGLLKANIWQIDNNLKDEDVKKLMKDTRPGPARAA